MEPSFAAIFTFQDAAGDYCFYISWKKVNDLDGGQTRTSFVRGAKKWTRFNAGANGPEKLLNATLTDLKMPSSWAIELLASHTLTAKQVRRLPVHLVSFTDGITLDQAVLMRQEPNQRFIRYREMTDLKSARQMTTYQYFIRNTDYTIELSKFNDIIYINSPGQNLETPRMQTDSWSLNVYRQNWDNLFAENAALKAGKRVEWAESANMEMWFPKNMKPGFDDEVSGDEQDVDIQSTEDENDDDGDGFTHLIGNLNAIVELVKG